jgi:hypothetical protein
VLSKTANRADHAILKLACDYATDLSFSKNGTSTAWVAWKNKAATVQIGDLTMGPFVRGMPDNVDQPIVFSKDGRHYCFFAYREHGLIAVIDGEEFGPYEGFREMPIISDSGGRVVYEVKTKGKNCVVDCGEPGDLYDSTVFGPSMDCQGKYIVYGAIRGNTCYVVKNKTIVETLNDRKAAPRLSPNGERIALVSLRGETTDVVVDGHCVNSHKTHEQVSVPSFVWSPDSRRIAYLCGTRESVHIMVDSERMGPFDDLRAPGIVFSDNGLHYAAIVRLGGRYAVLLDGSVVDYGFSYPAHNLYVASDGLVRLAEVDALRRTINWLELRRL